MRRGFSVIIPFARPERWAILCQQLSAISYSGSYEFIVVINHTSWRPRSIPQSLKRSLRVVYETKSGPSYARNTGIELAHYEYMVFFDDDSTFSENILNDYADVWSRHPDAKVIGGCVHAQKSGAPLTLTQKQLIEQFGWCFGDLRYIGGEKKLGFLEPLFAANFCIRQEKNAKTYFPTDLGKTILGVLIGGEDCLLCYQLVAQGFEIWYAPVLQVTNSVSEMRFQWWYIPFRSFLAGIERRVMDAHLGKQQKWPSFAVAWRQALKASIQGNFKPLSHQLRLPLSGMTILGYMVGTVSFRPKSFQAKTS